MTIEELYEWAKAHDALDLEIETFDSCGDRTTYIYPEVEIKSDTYAVVTL